ncbi:MAG TPA: hypothetical protein VLE96_06240 [Chlamydiales bacterium]|nr:hypothetical protein [Chlamydiales bacterium]
MLAVDIALFLILFVPLFFKRKKQIGKTWGGLVLTKVEINHIPLLCRLFSAISWTAAF